MHIHAYTYLHHINGYLFGSPEPYLFPIRSEIEPKTGTMVPLSVRI